MRFFKAFIIVLMKSPRTPTHYQLACEGYLLSVFIAPPPLSWWRLPVLMIGMLWLTWAEGGAVACSFSESLLLPSSLLEDEELLESEELSLLLSWSMERASAINSVQYRGESVLTIQVEVIK